jgi:hypothetical protein
MELLLDVVTVLVFDDVVVLDAMKEAEELAVDVTDGVLVDEPVTELEVGADDEAVEVAVELCVAD